jgi:hypothetical protein
MVEFLSSLYGELPPLRLDSPLTALNFRSSDAAVIAHGAMSFGNGSFGTGSFGTGSFGNGSFGSGLLTDSDFSSIQTVGDLANALGHVDARNISLESGST